MTANMGKNEIGQWPWIYDEIAGSNKRERDVMYSKCRGKKDNGVESCGYYYYHCKKCGRGWRTKIAAVCCCKNDK